ncbi:MAG: DUF4384 domain-containing protein [Gemmatimonadales bacterium]|nr:DUF4384 domain-containing protein [Gemmatimonadales bacterium]
MSRSVRLLSLLALCALDADPAPAQAPARIRVDLGLRDGAVRPGERVRVEVSPGDDGFLLVLHADTDGRIRVLFPLDPDEDPFVRGGRRLVLPGRGDRRTFDALGEAGHGTIVAALARDPSRWTGFLRDGLWDQRQLGGPLARSDDAEAALVDLAQRMLRRRFDYDVARYEVLDRELQLAEAPRTATAPVGGGFVSVPMTGFGGVGCDLATGFGCGRILGAPGPGIGYQWWRGDGWYDPWFDGPTVVRTVPLPPRDRGELAAAPSAAPVLGTRSDWLSATLSQASWIAQRIRLIRNTVAPDAPSREDRREERRDDRRRRDEADRERDRERTPREEPRRERRRREAPIAEEPRREEPRAEEPRPERRRREPDPEPVREAPRPAPRAEPAPAPAPAPSLSKPPAPAPEPKKTVKQAKEDSDA